MKDVAIVSFDSIVSFIGRCKNVIGLSGITKHDPAVVLDVLDVSTGVGLVAT
jgi:hypothetical protein